MGDLRFALPIASPAMIWAPLIVRKIDFWVILARYFYSPLVPLIAGKSPAAGIGP
jgi:hypothetical protein